MSIWQDQEIDLVIELYKSNKSRVDGMCNKVELYLEFEQKMLESGYNRSHQQIRKKIANLKADYRKNKPGSTGSSPSTWKWYTKMHEILQSRHFYNEDLASTFDSMADSSDSNLINDREVEELEIIDDTQSTESGNSIRTTPKTSRKRKCGTIEETNKKFCQFIDEFKEEYKKNQEEYRQNSQFIRNEISDLNNSIQDLINIIRDN